MELIADSIVKHSEKISKIAFIGLHGLTKRKFNKHLVHTLKDKSITKAYFTDAELAKEWLV